MDVPPCRYADHYIGAYYTGRRAGDQPGAMAPPALFKAGEAPYNAQDEGGTILWGDYSATSVDPVDDTAFWTIQEYASSPQDNWGTWIARLAYCPWDCDPSRDNQVNVSDVLAILGQYDVGAPQNCQGGGTCDFDGNGCVDVLDLLTVISHYATDPSGVGCDPF